MSDPVVRVENLSKQYRLGSIGTGTLRNDLQRFWANLWGKEDPTLKIGSENTLDGNGKKGQDTSKKGKESSLISSKASQKDQEYVWALKDINFEVKQGEVLGIIGKNGAGKSTLLKILSQVTMPSTGEVKVRGRIASLLEVGTGFHPELTGRENIFLNGAILGMDKAEIREKFDEIVEFSGITKYIDTPVKRYSSGMYVRLAFAVAAHLDPEILIVDEVLAVGDSVFQKKASEKMMNIRDRGKTILFVSHNLALVRSLCSQGLVLENGKMAFRGTSEECINYYSKSNDTLSGQRIDLGNIIRGNDYLAEIIFHSIEFKEYPVKFGAPIRFSLKLKSRLNKKTFRDIDFGIAINDRNYNSMLHCSNRFLNIELDHMDDSVLYTYQIDNLLKPGTYTMTLFLRTREGIQDWLTDIVRFEITDGNPYGFHNSNLINGAIFPNFSFYKE